MNDSWFDPSRRRISVKHVGLPAAVSLCERLKVGSTCIKLNNVLHMNYPPFIFSRKERASFSQGKFKRKSQATQSKYAPLCDSVFTPRNTCAALSLTHVSAGDKKEPARYDSLH